MESEEGLRKRLEERKSGDKKHWKAPDPQPSLKRSQSHDAKTYPTVTSPIAIYSESKRDLLSTVQLPMAILRENKVTAQVVVDIERQKSPSPFSSFHSDDSKSEDNNPTSPVNEENTRNRFLLALNGEEWTLHCVTYEFPIDIPINTVSGLAEYLEAHQNDIDEKKNDVQNILAAFLNDPTQLLLQPYLNFLCKTHEKPIIRYLTFWLSVKEETVENAAKILEHCYLNLNIPMLAQALGILRYSEKIDVDFISNLIAQLKQNNLYKQELEVMGLLGVEREPGPFYKLIDALSGSALYETRVMDIFARMTEDSYSEILAAFEKVLKAKKIFNKKSQEMLLEEFLRTIKSGYEKDTDLSDFIEKLVFCSARYFDNFSKVFGEQLFVSKDMRAATRPYFQTFLQVFVNDTKYPKVKMGNDYYFISEYESKSSDQIPVKKRTLMMIQVRDELKLIKLEDLEQSQNFILQSLVEHDGQVYIVGYLPPHQEPIIRKLTTEEGRLIVAKGCAESIDSGYLKKNENNFVYPSAYDGKNKIVPYTLMYQMCSLIFHITIGARIVPNLSERYMSSLKFEWSKRKLLSRNSSVWVNAKTIGKYLQKFLNAVLVKSVSLTISLYPEKYEITEETERRTLDCLEKDVSTMQGVLFIATKCEQRVIQSEASKLINFLLVCCPAGGTSESIDEKYDKRTTKQPGTEEKLKEHWPEISEDHYKLLQCQTYGRQVSKIDFFKLALCDQLMKGYSVKPILDDMNEFHKKQIIINKSMEKEDKHKKNKKEDAFEIDSVFTSKLKLKYTVTDVNLTILQLAFLLNNVKFFIWLKASKLPISKATIAHQLQNVPHSLDVMNDFEIIEILRKKFDIKLEKSGKNNSKFKFGMPSNAASSQREQPPEGDNNARDFSLTQ